MPDKVILLVDDDQDDIDMFHEAVREINSALKCITAGNGKVAIDLLNKAAQLPDLILLDINMPVMDGFECLKRLKQSKNLQALPVAMYSTAANHQEIKHALELGAFHYYKKPSDFKEIIKCIKSALQKVCV